LRDLLVARDLGPPRRTARVRQEAAHEAFGTGVEREIVGEVEERRELPVPVEVLEVVVLLHVPRVVVPGLERLAERREGARLVPGAGLRARGVVERRARAIARGRGGAERLLGDVEAPRVQELHPGPVERRAVLAAAGHEAVVARGGAIALGLL